MASPFPGMDPYLERFWRDFHASLIVYARDQLQGVLPRDLRARIDERLFLELPDTRDRSTYPDIAIVERPRERARKAVSTLGEIAVAEPLRIRVPDEEATQGYIEIIDIASGRRVVTAIEVLSPSNKVPGPGKDLYQQKQQECLKGRVNLVEIDLLRSGPWVLSVPEDSVPESHRTTYRVCVFRARAGWLGEVYRVPLRERLPVIGIPLRANDPDVPLDLQALVDQCYRNGAYQEDIDYQREPNPPLSEEDARWADALLRKQRRRMGKRQAGNGETPPRKRRRKG
ncbi:MAG: DUF4058 family protein [Planctomycetes bacterium]|nr:DUF4058 family protein [Planctomycetota bacterium]